MTHQTHMVTIDMATSGLPFDRYFLEGIGSCHAYLTLREDWRDHVRLVQREIGFKLQHHLPPNGLVYYDIERI